MYTTLISAEQAAKARDTHWVIIDCRCQLGSDSYGRDAFAISRVPGAQFAHLEDDLSGEILPGTTGRHPLPPVAQFANQLAQWGITPQSQVVAYDDAGGPYASRLWWMLKWFGHNAAAVLDGGWSAWQAAGLPIEASEPPQGTPLENCPSAYPAEVQAELIVSVTELISSLDQFVLIDARGANRYAGQDETIDPVAGHIPGALSYPFTDNLQADGTFKTPSELAKRFHALKDKPIVSYCGSGVTACHNILAMAHAGLNPPKLYAGSWSEWITDAARPIQTGESP